MSSVDSPADLRAGLHPDIPMLDYQADRLGATVPTLSASVANELLSRSPLHAYQRHPRLGGVAAEVSEEMERGSIIHALLLGGGQEMAVLPYENYRTKAAQEDRDTARYAGRIPVLAPKMGEYQAAARHLLPALAFLDSCETELTALWQAPEGQVWCRGRLDALHKLPGEHGARQIADLKIVSDAARASSDAAIIRAGYHVQAAGYCEAVELLTEAPAAFSWYFCEPYPPYGVAVVDFGQSLAELGARQWRRACRTWADCLASDRWPGYPRRTAQAPAWAIAQDYEQELEQTQAQGNEALSL